jgi:hypothetical protein
MYMFCREAKSVSGWQHPLPRTHELAPSRRADVRRVVLHMRISLGTLRGPRSSAPSSNETAFVVSRVSVAEIGSVGRY